MDRDEVYGNIYVPEDQNVEPNKKRKRKFHSSEYVSKESYVKCMEKRKKEENSVEENDFGDVFKNSLQENVAVTPENNQLSHPLFLRVRINPHK